MNDPFFFGYGSLVNQRTHDYPRLAAASVRGWRRVWQPSPLRSVAYLTAVPDPDGEIHGVIAQVPGGDWADLDHRERAYIRHPVPGTAIKTPDRSVSVQIYAVETAAPPNPGQPILMSYLDVVIQGYLTIYGPDGAVDFFASTGGWETPVLDDRSAPVYPRNLGVCDASMAIVDGCLQDLAAVVHDLEEAGMELPEP